jgi:hypothetical protein
MTSDFLSFHRVLLLWAGLVSGLAMILIVIAMGVRDRGTLHASATVGGRTIGTATTSRNQDLRDAGGRTAGTATRSESGQTTYRDNLGNTVGTSSQ